MAGFPRQHTDRGAIMAELHARPVDIVDDASRIRRLVFVLSPRRGEMEALLSRFRALGNAVGIAGPEGDFRHFSFIANEKAITWEIHTEFVTDHLAVGAG